MITVAPPWSASSASSWLSPSTQRQSVPAVKKCLPASPFDHCTMPPTPVVGTRLIQRHAADASRTVRRRRRHREEVAEERLDVGEQARLQVALIRQHDPHAAADGRPARVVPSSVPSNVLCLPLSRSSRK